MRYLLALFVLLSGCNYNKTKTNSSAKTAPLSKAQVENPDFQIVMKTVIGPKCLSCHANESGNKGSTNLQSFDAVKNVISRVAYRSLETRDMPPGKPLSETEAAILRNWWKNGSPEKVVGGVADKPGADLEKGPTNFAKVRDGIFKAKCLDCHQQPNPEAKLDLTDLVQVRSKIGAIVDRTFGEKADMPLAPYPSLTPVEAEVFFKWIANGMPQ